MGAPAAASSVPFEVVGFGHSPTVTETDKLSAGRRFLSRAKIETGTLTVVSSVVELAGSGNAMQLGVISSTPSAGSSIRPESSPSTEQPTATKSAKADATARRFILMFAITLIDLRPVPKNLTLGIDVVRVMPSCL